MRKLIDFLKSFENVTSDSPLKFFVGAFIAFFGGIAFVSLLIAILS